ncbi:MAG TPA: cytochrome d ubiquinol oxidase subunit II [Candidatus Baltobacteraceae bacterium]|nr:cytochrome d ubiquinol oxidase subunit II [Candidatus Baltobacteraceae bacterium]
MSIAAFTLIAFMLAMYVLLDGYDLGVATITPLVARSDRERAGSMESIGPFWNGNEVWLIAAGGALFALFPQAYASSFSGFYLAFVVVLWLLMFRGIAMELRSHFPSEIWHQFWDAAFAASSALLILLFGVALGNLVRGVPLDAQGYFAGTFGELLNPYAVLVGLFAVAALALHGTLFLVMRTQGRATERARRLVPRVWPVVLVLYVALSALTIDARGLALSWIDVIPLLSLAALVYLLIASLWKHERGAFAASSVFLASLLVQAAATMYPYLLPSRPPGHGISIFTAVPSAGALTTILTVAIVGVVATLIYGTFVLRQLAGKLIVEE